MRRSRRVRTRTAAATRSPSRDGSSPSSKTLHGDKAVWKLLDRHAEKAVDVPVDGPIPRDVDTWEDYSQIAR